MAAKLLYLLKTLLALGLIGMVLLAVYNVIGRYVFGNAFPWADEVIVFAMIVVVWLGGIVCVWERSELRMLILVDGLNAKSRHWVTILQSLIISGACGAAAWVSWGFLAKVFRFGMTSDAAGIPVWTVHSVVTASLAMISVLAMVNAITGILRTGEVQK